MRLSWECTCTQEYIYTQTHTRTQTHTHGSSSSSFSDSQPVRDMDLPLIFLFTLSIFVIVSFNPYMCVRVQLGGKIISLLGECVISVTGRVTGQAIPLHRCSAWWAIHKLWQRAERQRRYSMRVVEVYFHTKKKLASWGHLRTCVVHTS